MSRIWAKLVSRIEDMIYVIGHLGTGPMRRAQPRIVLNRELKTSAKMIIVQNKRLSDLASVVEQRANLDEHVKVVNALLLRDICGLLHDAPDIIRCTLSAVISSNAHHADLCGAAS